MGERRQLINLAYRLLGSLAEAEDAVQEAYARWYALPRAQQDAIASPGAWLTTVASRICPYLGGRWHRRSVGHSAWHRGADRSQWRALLSRRRSGVQCGMSGQPPSTWAE
jgi:DNA-directed RNA polymerase specialized sigma24 family protein